MTLAEADLAALVDEWLDWAEAASRLGVTAGQGAHHDPRPRARRGRPDARAPARRCRPTSSRTGWSSRACRPADRAARRRVRRPRVHRLALTDDDLPGPPDRRAAREPRRRGQAPRPGHGAVSRHARLKWNRTPIGGRSSLRDPDRDVVLHQVAFDHDGETITIGGDAARRRRPTATTRRSSGDVDPESGLPWSLAELPVEGQATLALIDQGGPFPYDKDGVDLRQLRGAAARPPARLLPRVHGRHPGSTIAAPAGSSPATAGSTTGPTTTTSRSNGSHGGSHERTGQDPGPPPRPGRLPLARRLPAAEVGTPSSTPAGGSGTSTAGTTRPATSSWPRSARRSPSPSTTGRTSTPSTTACATCRARRCCSGTAGARSPAPTRPPSTPSAPILADHTATLTTLLRGDGPEVDVPSLD